MREAYIPFFAWLDIIVYISACFTAEMGIVEKNTDLGCTYNVTAINNYNNADPSIYYTDLSAGCRVSSGLGVVILFLCLCTVYAALELKLPDLSNTAAGWEAYKLTEEEQRRRGTWYDYFWSFWPFGKKKKNTRNKGGAGVGGGGRGGRKKGNNWVEKNDGNGNVFFLSNFHVNFCVYFIFSVFTYNSLLSYFFHHTGIYYYNTKTNESTKVKPMDF